MPNGTKDIVKPVLETLVANSSLPEVLLALCDVCLNEAARAHRATRPQVARAWSVYAKGLFTLVQHGTLAPARQGTSAGWAAPLLMQRRGYA